MVVVQNKNYTALHIVDKTPDSLIFDEMIIPEARVKQPFPGWRGWIQSEAPGRTSWVRYTLSLNPLKVTNRRSMTQQKNLPPCTEESLFFQLTHLPFQPLPDRARRSILNKEGKSVPWGPKLVVDGKLYPNVSFSAWVAQWPKDGSILSGKELTIYLPETSPHYPSFFPTFTKVKGGVERASFRVVDSGRNL